MQRGDVSESATWAHDRERSPGLPAEEEETCISLGRFRVLLRLCIEVIEDAFSVVRIIDHPVQRGDDVSRIYLAVIWKQHADFMELDVAVRLAIVPRKK